MAKVLKEALSLDAVEAVRMREAGVLARMAPWEVAAGVLGLLIGAGLHLAGKSPTSAYIVGGVFLFLGIAHSFKRRESLAQAAAFRKGAEGERRVAEALERGLPDEYLVLHDVDAKSAKDAQCDHLVLGPNGAFIVETKAYSGTLTGGPKDATWTQTREWKGKRTRRQLTNPVSQNEYHLEVFRRFLAEHGYDVPDLHSIVVFTNPHVRLQVDSGGTAIVRPEELPGEILRRTASRSYDEKHWKEMLERTGLYVEKN